jgi:hypothetical protein
LAAELPSTIARRPSIVPTWTVEDGLAERISTSIEEFRSATARVVAGADKVQLALDHLLTAEGDYVSNLRATDTCPVCRTPGAEWVTTAKAEAARLRELLKAVHATKRKLGEAIKHLKRSMPPDLTEPTRTALRDLADNEGERRLAQWDEIARTYEQLSPDNATAATVERLVREAAELAAWYSGAAKVILSGHDSVVAEHATIRADICGWLDALDKARPDLDRAVAANSLSKTVEQWIKDTRDGIFGPIGTQVVQIWSDLNADADLKLTGLSLTGGVRQARKVDVTLSADGTPVSDGASNAAILSTGQRNALSLAAYLPRATQPASPFGFLVLDDPIHAFDVWRVRYLAKHLVSLAERYQIIVFTHDDRLWRELRALGCRPTHIRLDRPGGQKSHVRVKDVTRPSELMLDELQKVLDQENREPLGTEGARIAMTLAMCRQAVDTEVTTQLEILGRRLGKTEADIHADLRRARGTRDQLDLLNDYATAANRPPLAYGGFTSTINALNDGAHGRVPRNATLETCRDWVRQSRQLARRVYALAG